MESTSASGRLRRQPLQPGSGRGGSRGEKLASGLVSYGMPVMESLETITAYQWSTWLP